MTERVIVVHVILPHAPAARPVRGGQPKTPVPCSNHLAYTKPLHRTRKPPLHERSASPADYRIARQPRIARRPLRRWFEDPFVGFLEPDDPTTTSTTIGSVRTGYPIASVIGLERPSTEPDGGPLTLDPDTGAIRSIVPSHPAGSLERLRPPAGAVSRVRRTIRRDHPVDRYVREDVSSGRGEVDVTRRHLVCVKAHVSVQFHAIDERTGVFTSHTHISLL